MSKSVLRKLIREGLTVLALSALVGACSFAVAAQDKKGDEKSNGSKQGNNGHANTPPARGGNGGGNPGGGEHPNAMNGAPHNNPPAGGGTRPTAPNAPPNSTRPAGPNTEPNTGTRGTPPAANPEIPPANSGQRNQPVTNGNPNATAGGASRGSYQTPAAVPNAGGTRGETTPANNNPGMNPGMRDGRTTDVRTGAATADVNGRFSNNRPMPRGVTTRTIAGGNTVNVRANGRVMDVHDARTGVDVHHNLNGGSRVFVERPDHSRVVFERGRPGYVQRPFSFHGHDFARRTYFYNGHEYSRFYRGWGFHGLYLNVYAPGFYFGPAFYGWAYNPWRTPIAYGWGWRSRPWYGYYGGYFQPYPMYPSAAYWLTDYMISNDLEAAYDAHQDAGEMDGGQYAPGGPVGLTPDVKQQISDEVRNQLALENQEAQQNAQQQDIDPGSSGIARMLNDGRSHVFVAGAPLDLVDENGQECGVSDGDVLGLQGPSDPNAVAANLVVLASKGGQECPKGDVVAVQLTDLQGMQNHMRESIDQGLQELQSKQGAGGVPPAPPAAQAPPTPADYAPIAPPPDPNAAQEIQQEGQQGAQLDQGASVGQQ